MIIIRHRAYARAGLLGNPSDGYGGKTISIILRNFWAEVVLYEWDSVEILLGKNDRAQFESVQDLVRDVELHGYYGGIRLIKATIRRFVDYCERRSIPLHDRNFSVRYTTNIPRQVGLAGSSAIIVATLRCLMEFYDVKIPLEAQPTFVLAIEREELGIAAGLQDRVIQVYEGAVYMDFDPAHRRLVDDFVCHPYERLDPGRLPSLFVAYHADLSEPTETFHNDIRGRYDRGERPVVAAMERLAKLTEQGRQAIRAGDHALLARLVDENFDVRAGIYRLPRWQVQMVETARACGASAKFAGSGGAIVGIYDAETRYEALCEALARIGARTFRPLIHGRGE